MKHRKRCSASGQPDDHTIEHIGRARDVATFHLSLLLWLVVSSRCWSKLLLYLMTRQSDNLVLQLTMQHIA